MIKSNIDRINYLKYLFTDLDEIYLFINNNLVIINTKNVHCYLISNVSQLVLCSRFG